MKNPLNPTIKKALTIILVIGCMVGAYLIVLQIGVKRTTEREQVLLNQIQDLQKELINLRLERDSLEKYINGIEKQLDELRSERAEINKRIDDLNQKIMSYAKKYEKIADRYNNLVGDSLRLIFTKQFGSQ